MNLFCLRSVLTTAAIAGIIFVLVAGYMRFDIANLKKENRELQSKLEQYDFESKRLLEEYQNNMQKYANQKAKIVTVYKDKIKYIKESVDENTSCQDVINRFNNYQF
ncbi:MAG: hypothetical protein IE909_17810 [Campylobacterales bacterium]|nr:hypothetical protein [Campylobacterales bacterium]